MSPEQAVTDLVNEGMVNCNIRLGEPNPTVEPECRLGDATSSVRVVVMGDSHAHHWLPAFDLVARNNDMVVIPHTKSECPPVDVAIFNRRLNRTYSECRQWRDAVIADIQQRYGDVDAVVIARSSGYRNFVERDGRRLTDPAEVQSAWETGAAAMYRRLALVTPQVIVFHDTPWAPHDVPTCLSENRDTVAPCAFGVNTDDKRDVLQQDAERKAADTVMSEQPESFRVDFFDPTALVCPDAHCEMVTSEGIIKYRDSHHLTATYARLIAEKLWYLLPEIGR